MSLLPFLYPLKCTFFWGINWKICPREAKLTYNYKFSYFGVQYIYFNETYNKSFALSVIDIKF